MGISGHPSSLQNLKTANRSAAISELRVLRPSRFRPQAAIESRFFGRIRWLFNMLHMVYALSEVFHHSPLGKGNVRTFCPHAESVIGSVFHCCECQRGSYGASYRENSPHTPKEKLCNQPYSRLPFSQFSNICLDCH